MKLDKKYLTHLLSLNIILSLNPISATKTVKRIQNGVNCPRHCPKVCDNGIESKLKCPFGDSLVWDQCGCECRTCARQLNQPCNGITPCDDVKNLYCDENELICKNLPGKSCVIGGTEYQSGQEFQPSCLLKCTCLNGDIGCMSACPSDSQNINCKKNEKAIKIKDPKNECCVIYKCVHKNFKYEPLTDDGKHSHSIVAAAAVKPETIELIRRADDDCVMQTTKWSECTKSCGIGISERVSNNNNLCELKREVRLCNIRPCKDEFLPPPKKAALLPSHLLNNNNICKKPVRSKKSIRLSFSGCLSEKSFRPKYCPNCGSRCCLPKETETKKFNLVCSDGEILQKSYMWISECSCSEQFCQHQDIYNELFYGFKDLGTDTHK